MRLLPSLALLTLISACTGGGGDNITLTRDSQGQDPVVLEVPVAYIRRPIPIASPDLRDPVAFSPGAEMFVKDRSAVSAEEVDITAKIATIVAEDLGVSADELALDIKDLESSFDGETLVFAARVVPLPVEDNLEFTTWNLWLLDMLTLEASYLIPSNIKRNDGLETGGGQDIAPHFLPDDRIVFSSTRQVANQARQLNEGRAQLFAELDEDEQEAAAVLHIYDPLRRKSEFEQISFNRSHDLDPAVLSSGDIVFSRWSNTTTDHISLYKIAPSGQGLSRLYGYDSQDEGTDGSSIEYTQARELDDGRLVSVVKPFASPSLGGRIDIIDSVGFAEYDQPVWEQQGMPGPGQEPLTTTEVTTNGGYSRGGQFGSVYPLRDGTDRLLVTWSECRVIDEDGDFLPCSLEPDNTDIAPPLYGAWVYDPAAETQRPVVLAEEGFMISEIVAAEPRDFPAIPPQAELFDPELAQNNQGLLRIDSVYDLDGTDGSPLGIANHATPGTVAYTERPARFLRIVLPVPIPDDEVADIPRFAYGVSRAFSFREIVGYVPIEPDGSVSVTVTANQAFRISVLDANGRRLGSRHNNWLQLGAGEVLHCSGCHDRNSDQIHGRLDSQPLSSNPGSRDLPDGSLGFPQTDVNALFATTAGETMAEVWDFHRPAGNEIEAAREMALEPEYSDQWSAPDVAPDADITDMAYDPGWTDIPADKPIVVDNLDPTQPSRIVINYLDHIQPIWVRAREPRVDSAGIPVATCLGCHNNQAGSAVPAGQLDLSEAPSDIDADHTIAFRELLSNDNEQWIDNGNNVSDRLRICTEFDEDDNLLTFTVPLIIGRTMRPGTANGSSGFFACFEGGTCGANNQPALPDNCTEDGGIVEPATTNTVDHGNLLSPSELRLISEWLDIGAQYYNNPFDTRLL